MTKLAIFILALMAGACDSWPVAMVAGLLAVIRIVEMVIEWLDMMDAA